MTGESLRYIISVLKGEWADAQPEWYETLGFLYGHRIAGLFFSLAMKTHRAVPFKAMRLLESEYKRQERRTVFLREYIGELSREILRRDAPCVFLKGSLLSNLSETDAIYADGERASNDIDLLVPPEAIGMVGDLLKERGYVQGYYENGTIVPFSRREILNRRLNRGETAPFVKLTGNTEFPFAEVDINFSLGNIPGEHAALLDEMVDRRIRYCGKRMLPVSEPELFFLHLVLHQYKESALMFMAERGKELELYKLADIFYFWKSNALDKRMLKEISKRYGIEEKVGAVLEQVGTVFCCREMLAAAEEYGGVQPAVIDYPSQRHYRWTAGILDRLLLFDARGLLAEQEDGTE